MVGVSVPPMPADLVLPCLIRHATPITPIPKASPSRWCYGRSDWPASAADTRAAAVAWVQAHCAARTSPPCRALQLRCSTLQRCELLAQEIQAQGAHFGIHFALKKDPRLREIDFGRWEGRLWQDVPRAALEAWAADFANHPLGDTGQTVRAWLGDVLAALQDSGWASSSASDTQAVDDVWITHAGVIRAVRWWQSVGCPTVVPPHMAAGDWPVHAPSYGHWVGV